MQLVAESMQLRRPRTPILSRAPGSPESAAQLRPAGGTADTLLTACRTGDPASAGRLFTTYAPTVRAAIARFLAMRARARMDLVDDLTQEVFVALWRDDGRRLKSFQGRDGCSFAGWLRVVAVRTAIDALRRDRRTLSLDDDTPAMTELRRTLVSAAPDPESIAHGSETADRLARAVAALGPKDRLLVELHLLRGTPLPVVADTLGVTANAAYVRKSRVLERLRRSLEEPA
jgi:RNA polymerase sigma factor (sigma-70 family)